MHTQSPTTDLPAIAGGAPAKTTPFRTGKRYGDEELRELREALEQGSLFYAHGRKVKQLERDFETMTGSRFAVACSSGTAAIHAATIAIGLSPGEEVIVSPITDMGSVIPILYQGGVPVFADLDPHTYNLSADSVARNVTDKTRAILAVHLAGNACDLNALAEICQKRGLTLVEDCAQAHGARYDGRHIGTIGKLGCFSFNEFKHIACGDGGIVVTDDKHLASRLRLATDKCYDRSPNATSHQATFLANNYRMTELQAAVTVAQLRKLPSIVSRRQSWCARLTERLRGLRGLSLPRVSDRCESSWWFYMMRVDEHELGASTDEFAAAIQAERVPVTVHYIGQCVYESSLFVNHRAFERGSHPFAERNYSTGLCPTAEAILDTCVMLPVNEAYSDQDLEDTVVAIRRVGEWFGRKS
jgi:dTDP-4-amino-4,6-dideoxygalactose transaminase